VEQSTTLALVPTRPFIRRAARWSTSARALHAELRFELRAIAALTVISTVGTVAAPALRNRGLLLMALSPRLLFVALAAKQAPLPMFMFVGLVRLMVADPFNFAIGARLGPRVHRARVLRRLPASKLVAGVLVLFRPTGPIMAYAGSVGLNSRLAAVLDLISTSVFLFFMHVGVHRLFG
jgi:hypothetical protein